ncbi:MAG: insulinase family protein, partial [Anaerolineales bacterium]
SLSNGMTILVHENHIAPTVVVSGYLWSGSEDDPLDQLGLANFTVDVMGRGTINRTFSQLYEEIESIGASFGMHTGTHTTYFGAKGLTEHLPILLNIIKDALCNPAFLPEQVEKTRTELITHIEERIYDTPSMAALTFNEMAYPESHPYHWSHIGYEHTLTGITQSHLVNFHAQHFSPEHMVIAIVGDINSENVVSRVTELFSDWQPKVKKRSPLPLVAPLTDQRIKSVYVEDKTQSNIILGWPGPARKHPDFMPCFLANTVLGVFGMYGRLGKKVREEHSLAYYAYSSITGGLGPGPWTINTGVDPANTGRALDVILIEVERILDEPIPEDELEDSKAYLTGSLPLHLETNEGLMQSIINMERHALGLDYIQHYKANIMRISAQDILKSVQHWMDPNIYVLAVAGPTTYTPDGG